MGLGTLSVPVLLMIGYDYMQVVPTMVIVAAISGLVTGVFHKEFKNIVISFDRPLHRETKILLLLSVVGCIAIFISVVMTFLVIKPPEHVLEAYIGFLVLFMSVASFYRVYEGEKVREYRPKFLFIFASVAGINKGIGAGGYGPVQVLGQILSGIYEKTAAAISQTAEGIVSSVGAIAFFTIMAAGVEVDLLLLPSAFTGAFFASILAPYLLRVLSNKFWKIFIPLFGLSIGIIYFIDLLM